MQGEDFTDGLVGGCRAADRAHAVDVSLAQGTGFDVLRALHARAPDVDVYMLSNFATEPYRRLAERLGARGFFDKTTELERMRDAVAACAASRH